jgi:hypothetical protein
MGRIPGRLPADAPVSPKIPIPRGFDGNQSQAPAFSSTHPATDGRLKILERQAPVHAGDPLSADEEWRALAEICKTT